MFCFVILLGASILLTLTPQESAGKNEKPGKNEKLKKSERPIQDRYIVILNDEDEQKAVVSSEVETVANELKDLYGGRIEKQFTHAVKDYSVEMSAVEAENLSRAPRQD